VSFVLVGVLLVAFGPASLHGSSGSGAASGSSHSADPTIAPSPHSGGGVQPAATLTLSINGLTPTAISLAWTTSSTFLFSSFTVEYSVHGAGGPFVTLATITSSSTTSYGYEPLVPETTYWWEVTETQTLGGTSTSNVVSATQPAVAVLTAHVKSGSPPPIQLNWTDNATYGGLLSFSSFQIFEESAATGGAYQLVTTISTESTRTYTVFVPSGNYSFYLNTTNCLSACGGTGSLVTSSNPAVVGSPFPLGVSIAPAHTVLDVNESDVLLCAASGGEPSYSYAWSVDGSAFAAGNSTLGVAFSTNGIHAVACQVTDGTPVTDSTSIDLTVNPALVAVPSLNRTNADVYEPVSFDCSSTGGTGPVSFSWSFGDATGESGSAATHAYATSGTYITTCVASDNAGVTTSASVIVTVDPVLSVAVSASSPAAAPGTTLSFTASAHNGSGDYTKYSWQFGSDPSTANSSTPKFAFPAPGTYPVTVRIVDSNGITASGATSVTISPLVATPLAAPTHGTAGSTLAFSASASGGAGGTYNYTWSFGDGSVAYGATVFHSYGSAGTYSPTLTIRDHLGAKNVTDWSKVSVTPAPGPLAWLPLWVLVALGAAVGGAIATVVYVSSRDLDSEMLARWVPPVGPRGALRGSKTCPKCGAENPPVRRTCGVCGAALPRSPQG
jgi:PKD repeat protein